MQRRELLAAGLGLAVGATSGWPGARAAGASASASSSAALPAVIRVAVSSAGVGQPPRVGTGTLDIVQSQHLIEDEFKAENTRIEWFFNKGAGPATNEQFSSGLIDFGSQGALPSLIGRAVGVDTRVLIVSGARSNSYVGVQPASPIRSIAELRGKRVAVHKGTAGHLSGLRILETVGLSEKDVKLLNLDTASAMAAFESGDLDAVFGTTNLLPLRDAGRLRLIFDTRKTPVNTAPGNFLVRTAFEQQYPEAVRRVAQAFVKAARWGSDDANRDAVFALWGQFGNIRPKHYAEEYDGVPLRERLSPIADPFVLARLRDAAADSYRFKLIRKPVDVAGWIDTAPLQAALDELKLASYWPRFDAAGARLPALAAG